MVQDDVSYFDAVLLITTTCEGTLMCEIGIFDIIFSNHMSEHK